MSTNTPNLNLILPTVNVDTGWGGMLNSDLTIIDNIFADNGTGTGVGMRVGSGKTLTIAGNLVLGGQDGTDSPTTATVRGPDRTGDNKTGVNVTIDAGNGTGTGGSGNVVFRTAPPSGGGSTACTMQDSLIISNAGDVGIGVSSPTSQLHIRSNTNGLKIAGQIQNRNAGASAGGAIAFINSESDLAANRYGYIGAISTGAAQNGNNIIIAPNANGAAATERFRFNGNGAIGIGGANFGSIGRVLTSNGSGAAVSWENVIKTISSENLSGQTSVSFSGIPSYAETVQIVFHRVKMGGSTGNVLIRLSDGSVYTSGYLSISSVSGGTLTADSTIGFNVYSQSATAEMSGVIWISRIFGNTWDCSYSVGDYGNKRTVTGGGSVSISNALTGIVVATSNGTAFASGNVRVMSI